MWYHSENFEDGQFPQIKVGLFFVCLCDLQFHCIIRATQNILLSKVNVIIVCISLDICMYSAWYTRLYRTFNDFNEVLRYVLSAFDILIYNYYAGS